MSPDYGKLRDVLGERRLRGGPANGADDDALGLPSADLGIRPESAALTATAAALPGTALPEIALPETALPETALPETALPETALPGTAAPATAARPASVWRDPVTWAIAVTVFCVYFAISLFRLLRLSPTSYDLGIYTEYVKQLSQLHAPVVDILGPGFNLLGNHFQVALALLAPFFRVFPSPATLLFFQAALTAVSVFPVAAAGFALTGRNAGRLIAFAYGFSWGLQQMVDDDFHEIALALPLLAFSVSALVRRRPLAAIGWAVPLVFVKEDQGFTVAAIGALLMVSVAFPPPVSGGWRARLPFRTGGFGTDGDGRYRDGRWGEGYAALWGGLFLVTWGLFWSVIAITVLIPHFNPAHQYYFWKDGGVVGGDQSFSAGGLIGQTASGWPVKLQTVVLLLLPTAFAAAGSPVALLGLPILAMRFMSTNTAYWGTAWHYNATLMPILFIAAAEAIARWQPAADRQVGHPQHRPARSLDALNGAARSGPGAAPLGRVAVRRLAAGAQRLVRPALTGTARHGGAMMALAAVALAFQFPLCDLWHGSTYQLGPHVAAADAAMAAVPDDATVQTTLDLLAPLAARTDTFWIGTAGNPLTQYVVFDGTDSGYSPAITNVPAFIKMLYPRDGYVQVFERDDVYVFRRS
jgi:uncharacterized membrane protein